MLARRHKWTLSGSFTNCSSQPAADEDIRYVADVTINLTPEAAEWLAQRGYDERMGARPLGRTIQEHVKKPLADQVLFGELVNGGTVTVAVVGVGPDAKLELIAAPPRPAKPKAIPGPKAAAKKPKAEEKS